MTDLDLIAGVGAVGLIVGVVEVVKRTTNLNPKYAPVLSLGLGIGASFGYSYYGGAQWFTALIMGLAVGLSAIGGYSGTKNVLEALNK